MSGTCVTGGSRKRTRKMRGGNMYGFGGTIGTAGAQWGAVANTEVDKVTGAAKPDIYDIKTGGRRRGRKSRKVSRRHRRRRGGTEEKPAGSPPETEQPPQTPATLTGPEPAAGTPPPKIGTSSTTGSSRRRKSKKSRKVSRRRHRMRGGGGMLPSYPVSAGFTGSGQRGIINVENVAVSRPNDVVGSS